MRKIENKCSNCADWDTCPQGHGVVVWKHCEKFIPAPSAKELLKQKMVQEAANATTEASEAEPRPYVRRCVKKVDRAGRVLDLFRTTHEAAEKCGLTRSRVYSHCAGLVKDPFANLDYTFLWEDEELEVNDEDDNPVL